MQPGLEEGFDVPAAARLLEPSADMPSLENQERGERLDRESFDQVGAIFTRNSIELERAMVAPALEHLREKPLRASARAGLCRVKEHESRLGRRLERSVDRRSN